MPKDTNYNHTQGNEKHRLEIRVWKYAGWQRVAGEEGGLKSV
jgi:hypothetical protein